MNAEETSASELTLGAVRHARRHGGDGSEGDGGGNGHEDVIDLNVARARPVWVVVAGVLCVAALALLLVTGLIPRRRETRELRAEAMEAQNAPVLVNVARPHRGPTTVAITIPGNLRPWQEVSLFARTTGYLRKYYVDISSEVEKGALLADIDSPEVDQQLEHTNASLVQM